MVKRPQQDPKVEAFEPQRALNPRPGAVLDPAFASSEFLDARDLVQVKYEMVRRVRIDRAPVDARQPLRSGSPGRRFTRRRRPWTEAGLPGLVPAGPAPPGATSSADEVVDFAEAALGRDPSFGQPTCPSYRGPLRRQRAPTLDRAGTLPQEAQK